jgi:chromosomal replication initiation ATPase DnaA
MTLAETILAEVAEAHGVTVHDIRGPMRFKENVAARRYAISRLLAAGFNFRQISRLLNRHHTTIHASAFKKTRDKKRQRYLARRNAA